MTPLDAWVGRISTRLGHLKRREAAALYFSIGCALRPLFDEWAAHASQATTGLDWLMSAAEKYVMFGEVPENPDGVLARLDHGVPPGESPDEYSTTGAQDCWISFDSSLRIGITDYPAGDAFWYCVEPLAQSVCEARFGYTELDSSDIDAATEVFEDPSMTAARDAVERMLDSVEKDGFEALPLLRDLAQALVPT